MASLTLTDPDMILPYNGSERESSTPSPPSQLVYLSNLSARYNEDPYSLTASGSRSKKKISRHARAYEEEVNFNRRLPDIEETSPRQIIRDDDKRMGQGQGQEQGREISTVLDQSSRGNSENSELNSSNSSPSLISTLSAGSVIAPNGRNISPIQSVAADSQKLANGGLPDSSLIASIVKVKAPGEEHSSVVLSREAERILENAKKRLTLMEGNLNRARTAVRLSPSPSPSAAGYNSPIGSHKPVGGLYQSISRTGRASALRRQSLNSSKDYLTTRHSRVHSDMQFPSDASSPSDKRMSRSVSAMGASSVTSFHKDERSFQYGPTRSYLTHRSSALENRPPSIKEDLPKPTSSPPPVESPIPEDYSPLDSPADPDIGEDDFKSYSGYISPSYSGSGPPSRAQSQLQVRDLQYQMKGLHIKISSLKVKNQKDNMRRRSIQSLRTPSPLTAADPWYSNGLETRDGRSSRSSGSRRVSNSEYAHEPRASHESVNVKDQNNTQESQRSGSIVDRNRLSQYGFDGGNQSTMSSYEDAEEGDYFDPGDIDRDALDEILREPLDEDLQALEDDECMVDTRPHEEREDAFDYEHFILHSALGNYSRHKAKRPSISSRRSVETSRPAPSRARMSRTNSVMSTSTVDTFATAVEGDQMANGEDDIGGVLYWDRRFNFELRHRHQATSPDLDTIRSETPHESPRQSQDFGSGTTTPQQSPRASKHEPATPTALASSLVSTVRAAASPHPGSPNPGINEDDTQTLESLFASLGNVCMELQAITSSPDPDLKAARLLRRRLDAARRVLDGELDT
ncbi:hypothetical protein N7495_005659 [Penicillium taxi]|uniref:uncharacterized protein n=1 Tax=Penicillium taxi TaxID=168475 RepID=UPI00254572AF|nr:uncharacterized protein N7495_005659 [Penicillium taxi]KAJ5893968.1 hypothetical protein N7495_005659 [Penicillium taxi]